MGIYKKCWWNRLSYTIQSNIFNLLSSIDDWATNIIRFESNPQSQSEDVFDQGRMSKSWVIFKKNARSKMCCLAENSLLLKNWAVGHLRRHFPYWSGCIFFHIHHSPKMHRTKENTRTRWNTNTLDKLFLSAACGFFFRMFEFLCCFTFAHCFLKCL